MDAVSFADRVSAKTSVLSYCPPYEHECIEIGIERFDDGPRGGERKQLSEFALRA